jgi:putative heme-binding domain-containing protein
MAKLFPAKKEQPRSEIVTLYREAMKLRGDPENGFAVFKTACASCHRSGAEGHAVGPDLVTFKTAGAESIITNLFDPNKEVAPQFQTYLFTLKNGEQTMGIIGSETTTEVTVKMAFGLEKTFPRADVANMKATRKSLMPEGLESTLSVQSVADLLAYLSKE